MPAKRAHIQTFGCQMNEHDSQRMAKILESAGYEMTDDPAQAQVVLVNTCSVRENPENKVYSLLGRLRRLKKNGARVIIGVAGCVAQQEGEAILNREKCVDLVFGPDNYFDLPDMIAAAERGERVLNTEWLSGRRKVRNFIPEERMEQGRLRAVKATSPSPRVATTSARSASCPIRGAARSAARGTTSCARRAPCSNAAPGRSGSWART